MDNLDLAIPLKKYSTACIMKLLVGFSLLFSFPLPTLFAILILGACYSLDLKKKQFY